MTTSSPDPRPQTVADLSAALSFAEHCLVRAEKRRRELERRLREEEGRSRVQSQLRSMERVVPSLHRRARQLLPRGSRRRAVLAGAARRARGAMKPFSRSGAGGPTAPPMVLDSSRGRPAAEYAEWLRLHEPDQMRLDAERAESARWACRPLVSVIMPVYQPQLSWLVEAVKSVREQTYTNWELCIADDHSSSSVVRAFLEETCAEDARVRAVFRAERGGISAASNSALELAVGEHIALLDHDDILRPQALHRMVGHINNHPGVGFVYSDEDKLQLDGTRGQPFFKPDWSPDLLLSCNYLCHLSVIRRDIVIEMGGFRSAFDGSQDHDLFLRVTEGGCGIGHVPEVLYTWRQVEGSAALSTSAKPYAHAAGERAIAEALTRRRTPARVAPAAGGWYHVQYPVTGSPSVGIIIPTRDRGDLLRSCIESIVSTSTYDNFSIIVVDNDSRDEETLDYLARGGVAVLRYPGYANLSRMVNQAARELQCDHLLLLHNDTAVITPGWIEALLEHSQRAEVGAVGGRLLLPDGRLQHEGISLAPGHPETISGGYHGLGRAIREVAAVSGACLMVERAKFEKVGGLDERLRISHGDVDLCLRLGEAGHRTIYTPRAQLHHDAGSSLGGYSPPGDTAHFAERWGPCTPARDPFTNPNIASMTPFTLRLDPTVPFDDPDRY